MPGTVHAPLRMHLRDGTPVLIRSVIQADKALLKEGFFRLSRKSRHMRFFSEIHDLSDRQLRYFTQIDYSDHMAWIALDPSASGQQGLGVARYVRLDQNPRVAEAAITVVDSVQGRGLGTLLLGALSRSAVENGIDTFVAYVLAENERMLEIFRELGGHAEPEPDGTFKVEVKIPNNPQDYADTPAGRVFKAVALQMSRND